MFVTVAKRTKLFTLSHETKANSQHIEDPRIDHDASSSIGLSVRQMTYFPLAQRNTSVLEIPAVGIFLETGLIECAQYCPMSNAEVITVPCAFTRQASDYLRLRRDQSVTLTLYQLRLIRHCGISRETYSATSTPISTFRLENILSLATKI